MTSVFINFRWYFKFYLIQILKDVCAIKYWKSRASSTESKLNMFYKDGWPKISREVICFLLWFGRSSIKFVTNILTSVLFHNLILFLAKISDNFLNWYFCLRGKFIKLIVALFQKRYFDAFCLLRIFLMCSKQKTTWRAEIYNIFKK